MPTGVDRPDNLTTAANLVSVATGIAGAIGGGYALLVAQPELGMLGLVTGGVGIGVVVGLVVSLLWVRRVEPTSNAISAPARLRLRVRSAFQHSDPDWAGIRIDVQNASNSQTITEIDATISATGLGVRTTDVHRLSLTKHPFALTAEKPRGFYLVRYAKHVRGVVFGDETEVSALAPAGDVHINLDVYSSVGALHREYVCKVTENGDFTWADVTDPICPEDYES